MRFITAACCAVALTAMLAPAAHADDYNKRTLVTFSGPVQVPGATLPAGTYTFKLADPESSRRVIQIWNKDATHLYTTLLTMTNERMEPTNDPVVMFKENVAGQAPAVQAWFYPGDRFGEEFVYPKDQAMKIAKATHKPVLATADNTSNESSIKSSKVGHVDENGQFTADDNKTAQTQPASVTAQNNAPAPVPTSGVAQAQAPTAQSNNNNNTNSARTRSELPRTASELPAAILGSILMLAFALVAHRVRLAGVRG
jgi:thiol:disulfide interchange protein